MGSSCLQYVHVTIFVRIPPEFHFAKLVVQNMVAPQPLLSMRLKRKLPVLPSFSLKLSHVNRAGYILSYMSRRPFLDLHTILDLLLLSFHIIRVSLPLPLLDTFNSCVLH